MTGSAQPPKMVRVLTIDGGGIRGIIPALILDYLENSTKSPTSELFDVLAGTSTGGILALGLTVPGTDGKPAYAASDLVELYPLWGKRIFPTGGQPTVRERLLGRGDTFSERMGNSGRLISAPFGGPQGSARHTAAGLDAALEEYFGNVLLSEALVEVAITSYDATNGRPFLFSRRDSRARPELNFAMRVAARATSAGPTYFPPQLVTINNSAPLELIDGGLWANNPAVIGYHEALRLASERRLTADNVLLVSLGTGSSPTPGEGFKTAASWLGAFRGLAQLATDTSVDDFLINRQLSAGPPKRYWRFQTFDASAAGHMDDPTPDRIQALVAAANRLIDVNVAELDRLGTALTAARGPR